MINGQEKITRRKKFRKLLGAFEPLRPKRGTIVTGEVLRIDEDAILLDIGAQQDAIVPRKELDNFSEDDLAQIQMGDRLPVYIVKTARWGGDLVVSIERGMAQQDWDRAEEYLSNGESIELEVIGDNRGGVLVRFGQLRGFVPNSHLSRIRGRTQSHKAEYKRSLIGSNLLLKVIEVKPRHRRLILSAHEARKDQRMRRLRELQVGQALEGHVVNLVEFGAFVDLDGIDGLLHISEIGYRTDLEDPSGALEIGQLIEVMIKDIDVERERVSLTRKSLLASPWDSAASNYKVGTLVEGIVTSVVDFGAFVRLADGIEGLIHKSEMGIVSLDGPSAAVHEGDRVLVRILSIDAGEQRMSLSLRDVTYEDEQAWGKSRAERTNESGSKRQIISERKR